MPEPALARPWPTLPTAILAQAQASPTAIALTAPGRPPLTYAGLAEQIRYVVAALADLGLGRGARVGTALPNGPELALATLAISAGATCVPLNPSLRSAELRGYLDATRCDAIVVRAGHPTEARDVAHALGIQCVEVALDDSMPAGALRVVGIDSPSGEPIFAEAADTALLMQTSGTTGDSSRPRLVPLTHSNVYSSALHTRAALELTPSDRCLNAMPVYLIHGIVGATFSSLSAGASVVCVDRFEPASFLTLLETFDPTWYTAVPAMHQALLEQLERREQRLFLPALRFARSSSSPLAADCLMRLEAALGVPVIESYGMTEAASQIASNPLPPRKRKPGSVGLPNGPEVAIRTEHGNSHRPGERGEIVVRGPNVMRGYEGDSAATAEAFVAGWLRTGDEGYFDEDGYLFITGRLKEFINRGGEKILPGEVDHVLRQHPAVLDAAAFGRPHPRLGEVVAAAVVLRPGATLDRDELRTFGGRRLSASKVPHEVYVVDALPRNPLGKLQRRVLARQLLAQPAQQADSDRQVSPLEQAVRSVWSDVLRIPSTHIRADDDFFLLGGDSLLALQAITALGDRFQVELSPHILFEAPTVRALAGRLKDAPPRSSLQPNVASASLGEWAPLSYAQQRFWFVDQLDRAGCVNNIARVFRLRGPLDVEALARALRDVVEHQPALRTIIRTQADGPVQQVQPPRDLQLPVVEVEEGDVNRLAREEVRRPFDLERDLPIRARLLRISALDAVLVVTLHHIATDGWSTAIVEREWSSAYAARLRDQVPVVSPLPFQYTDVARWQREQVQAGAYAAQLEFWKGRLQGAPAYVPLPTRGRRPRTQTFRGALHPFTIGKDTLDGIGLLARQHRATPYMALLALYAALLGRYTGEQEVVIGTPVAGRNRPESHALVGCFINSVPLRIDVSGHPSFRELLGRVRQVVLEALAHQDVPFDLLVEALDPVRDGQYAPLFQTMFALQNLPTGGLQLPDVEATELLVDLESARLDLTTILRPDATGGLRGSVEYNTDLFDAETVAGLVDHYQRLLRGVLELGADHPLGSMGMLSERELAQVLVDLNRHVDEHDYPRERSVVDLFQAQASRTPSAPAIRVGDHELTYGDLERRSNQLARVLHERRQQPGNHHYIGVCLPRSADFVVAVLAVLKAGAAYVPLDAAHPTERLAFVLRDSQTQLLITTREQLAVAHLQDALAESEGVEVVLMDPDAADMDAHSADPVCPSTPPTAPAYLLYTSGSTGQPKGVVVPHRAIVRLVCGTDYLQLGRHDRVAFVSDLSFDASTFELWGGLLNGACLIALDKATLLAPRALRDALSQYQVTAMFVTTSVFNLCAREQPDAFGALDHLLFGGEAADVSAVRAVLDSSAPPARLLNVYGPTESTTFATWYHMRDLGPEAETVPIGRPIAHTQAYVLDANRQPVPGGVTGELWLGGDGLAIGYLNDPELTQARFVPDVLGPGSGRLYRTGDLVRLNADGQLVFVGRVDDQVKIRGIRVEPGEVQAALEQLPSVDQAAVVTRTDTAGTRQLVAYVVPSAEATVDSAELRGQLAQRLPEACVPARIAILGRLPLTPSGKVDRDALRSIQVEPAPEVEAIAPRTQRERALQQIWASVLGVPRVGVRDNFFELGGHSLLAARLFTEIERAFSIRLPLASLFPEPTIERQAELLDQQITHVTASSRSVIPIQPAGAQPPFLCVHAIDGDVLRFEPLAHWLGPEQPFYALRAHGLDPDSEPIDDVELMACRYIEQLVRDGFREPFYLGGFSAGATIAFEMASQLVRRGQRVALLALIDGAAPGRSRGPRLAAEHWSSARADLHAYAMAASEWGARAFLHRQLRGLNGLLASAVARPRPGEASLLTESDLLEAVAGLSERHLRVAQAQAFALQHYVPQVYPERVVLVRARVRRLLSSHDRSLGWDRWAPAGVQVVSVGGEHAELLREPYVRELAARLSEAIHAAH